MERGKVQSRVKRAGFQTVPLPFIDITNFEISTILVRRAQAGAHKLNAELVEFTTILGSLRPPPPGIRRL
jgi:hypothetical protein